MKKRELQELRAKDFEELKGLFSKKRQELSKTILELRSGKLKNLHTGRTLRRDIAQIATLVREKVA